MLIDHEKISIGSVVTSPFRGIFKKIFVWGALATVVLVSGGAYFIDHRKAPPQSGVSRPTATRWKEGEIQHPLLFDKRLSDVRTIAPELFSFYTSRSANDTPSDEKVPTLSAAFFDLNDDGSPEIFIYDPTAQEPNTPGFPLVYVYSRSTDGVWRKNMVDMALGVSATDTVETWQKFPPESAAVEQGLSGFHNDAVAVRTTAGDCGLSFGGGSVYTYLSGSFSSSGWSMDEWRHRLADWHARQESPFAFVEYRHNSMKTITSDAFRVSLDVPVDWLVRGRIIDGAIGMNPPGEDGDGMMASGIGIVAPSTQPYGPVAYNSDTAQDVDATAAGFSKLTAMSNGTTKRVGNNIFTKIKNMVIDGNTAVLVNTRTASGVEAEPHDNDVYWVRKDGMNWYISISDFSPEKYRRTLNAVIASIKIN